MNLWKELRWTFLAGGAPCVAFIVGALLSFWVYPYDVDGASKTLMICAGTGALVGIFMVVHRVRKILKK